MKMIELMEQRWNIINVDESWINETNFTRLMWRPPNAAGTIIAKTV